MNPTKRCGHFYEINAWCLKCVQELWEERRLLREALEAILTADDNQTIPIAALALGQTGHEE